MDRKKVLIVDDHELIHKGISDILVNLQEYILVGQAFSGEEAVQKTRELEPDIILMDISMPGGNGIDASRKILSTHPGIKIIALSQHDSKEYITQMLDAGCLGYLLKNSRKDEIISALEMVSRNKRYINPQMIDLFMSERNKDPDKIKLTRRELEVLSSISEGKNNPEIAEALNISVRTVETHRRNLMQKLKVNSVVELIKKGVKLKLIEI